MADEHWETFGFRFGPFEMSVSGLSQWITHTRTETSHLLRIRMDPAVKKEEIKVRLVRPGLLEIEWPLSKGEEIPVWLSQLHDDGRSPHPADREADPSARQHLIQTRLAAEVEVLRWCIRWLERLEHEDHVVVNLRPESEEETEFVPFDRPRVLRVCARMAADLDELARRPLENTEALAEGREELRARHRQRLAEPEPQPRRRSPQEERAALRQAKGLPPYERREGV